MQIPYETPTITDLGSITDHTFNTPSPHPDDKSGITWYETDKFGEFSHPPS